MEGSKVKYVFLNCKLQTKNRLKQFGLHASKNIPNRSSVVWLKESYQFPVIIHTLQSLPIAVTMYLDYYLVKYTETKTTSIVQRLLIEVPRVVSLIQMSQRNTTNDIITLNNSNAIGHKRNEQV